MLIEAAKLTRHLVSVPKYWLNVWIFLVITAIKNILVATFHIFETEKRWCCLFSCKTHFQGSIPEMGRIAYCHIYYATYTAKYIAIYNSAIDSESWDVQGWPGMGRDGQRRSQGEAISTSCHPPPRPPPPAPPAAYFAKLSRLRISLRIVIKLSPPPSLFLNSDTVTNYHDWERQDWMGDVNLDKFAID